MKKLSILVFVIVYIFICSALVSADPSSPFGLWKFNDAGNLTAATIGSDLGLTGSVTAASGIDATDGAAFVGSGSYLTISGMGDGTTVWSMLMDIKFPASTIGKYQALYQTSPANVNDAECFLHKTNRTIGGNVTGYSTNAVVADRWYRLIVAWDTTTPSYGLYVDGVNWDNLLDGSNSSDTFRYELDNLIHLFADEDGEDPGIYVSNAAFWTTQLSAADAAALGVAGDAISFLPDSNSLSIPVISGPTQTNVAATETYSFTADDIDGNDISYQIDWGDGQVSNWSSYIASGAAFTASHSWSNPGNYNIKARAKDIQGAVSAYSAGYGVLVIGTASGSFTYGPYLQNVSTDAITIMWVTNKMVTASVTYSTDDSYENQIFGSCIAESGVYICKVRLTDLDIETTYNYIAYAGGTASQSQTFSTAPYDDAPFGFCVWGDSQQEVTPSNAMFTGMANSDTDFGLSVGDIVQDPTWAYTKNPFLKYALDKLAKVKPVFIGYGNHDGGFSSIPRKFTEQPTTLNYTFTYGNANFTVLDYADYGGSGWVSYVPTAWVKSALSSPEAQSATWRFFVLHVPPYGERWIDGNAKLRAQLVPLLEEYNVDMVFSGHIHEYERGFLNDVHYVVTGCGSYLDTAESVVKDWDHMTVGGAQNIPPFIGGLAHGYTEIQIDGNKLELKQHAYKTNGSYHGIIDTVSVTKAFNDSDFNFDGKVDYTDLDYIAKDWTKKPSVDLYLGQNFDNVNEATPLSPEFMGNMSTLSYQPSTLQPDTTYYWRIDDTDTIGQHKGEVWQFTTGDNSSNIGWWKLDTSALDSGPAQNHGQIFGQMETVQDPNWAQCLSFEGPQDSIQVPNESDYDLTDRVTIAAWILLDTDYEGMCTIVSKGSSYLLYVDTYIGIAAFSNGPSRPVKGSTNLCDNKWHHVVAIFDETERAIYIDGVKEAFFPSLGSMVLNDEPLLIGNSTLNGENLNFRGSIRELRIYSNRLSDDQILWLSQTGNHSPQPFNGMDNTDINSELKFYPHYWLENQKADLNKDFVINFIDFAILANEWLK